MYTKLGKNSGDGEQNRVKENIWGSIKLLSTVISLYLPKCYISLSCTEKSGVRYVIRNYNYEREREREVL